MNRTGLRRILAEEGLTASEQEADKLEAEAEASEQQAEADRAKADAARMASGDRVQGKITITAEIGLQLALVEVIPDPDDPAGTENGQVWAGRLTHEEKSDPVRFTSLVEGWAQKTYTLEVPAKGKVARMLSDDEMARLLIDTYFNRRNPRLPIKIIRN
jgi:hypothetical protein